MANITIAEVDVAIPEFWAATALGALKANTVMAQLVRRDFDNEIATRGDTVNVTRRGTLSVNDKTANTSVTLQAPTNSNIPVQLDRHKEVSFLVEDVASAKAVEDAINYVEDAAIIIGETVDTDLLGLFTEAGSFVGTFSDDLDVPIVVAARKSLNDQKCPQRGRVFVIGSGPEASLLNKTEFTSSDFGGDVSRVAVIEANLGRKYGFDFFMDQQVIELTPNEVRNIAFHRDSFVLVSRLLPAPPAGTGATAATVSEDGVGMRSIRSWNSSFLGMQMTVDVLYGVKALRADTHAVEVRTNNSSS